MTDADELIAYLRAQGVAISPRVAVLVRRKIDELLRRAALSCSAKVAAACNGDDVWYCADCGAETDGTGCKRCD